MTDDDRPILPSGLAVDAMLDLHHPIKVATSIWAAEHLSQHDMVANDRTSTFAADDWQRCADAGLLGLLVPADVGGQEADLVTALLRLEGLGHGCPDNGLTFALASQVFSTQIVIDRFGNDEQRHRWLPGMCDGTVLGAFAITETEAGSDPFGLQATAVAQPDGSYILNGHKAHLTLGSRADVAVVFASTRPEAGRWGITAFLVPTDVPGVELLGNREKMGMRTTPFGDIQFTDVVVPESSRLGREGAGASIFTATLEAERGFVFVTQIGMMERLLDASVAYAKSRTQGGQVIGSYQAVSHRLADMKLQHETARLFLYSTAMRIQRDEPATMAAALSKLVASESAVAASLSATLVHGARGYVTDDEIERNLRDAIGGLVYSGTSDIQRNIVARLMGVG